MIKLECAHFIKSYKGKCRRLHGHTYTVVVLKPFEKLDRKNMAKDFKELENDKYVNKFYVEIEEELDHKNLNQVFGEKNLTVEILARGLYLVACRYIDEDFGILVQEGNGGFCFFDGKRWWLGK
ncbi:MAG: 6-carboxytetrahydropterin synthase [Candidatus Aenigmatarchaeota archaeon]